MAKDNHIVVDIPEAKIDFSNPAWKDIVKNDFREIQNSLESKPNPASPAYYTWFWFFMKYGRALCSQEGQAYLKANGLNPFTFVKDVVGLTMSGGGAYTIGYKFFEECLNNTSNIDVNGIKINERETTPVHHSEIPSSTSYSSFLDALRTKPFLLLAGISGTGKSRIVKEMAFKSCPSYLRDEDGTTPGNYCMIEVKPNWHDSSELLGYYSNISKKYIFTKFVKFLVKAMMHPTVPFFVCLDEMNLAPVEQYFAEFLSVLETRKYVDETVKTGTLVNAEYFCEMRDTLPCKNNGEVYMALLETGSENTDSEAAVSDSLLKVGLTLPENVFVIGTVNMDDTTHQFSRKVIDRAMTIEMNGGNLEDMFGGSSDLDYPTEPDDEILSMETLKARYVSADDVLDKCERIKSDEETWKFVTGKDAEGTILKDEDTLPNRLNAINKILENTPFRISYRVFNELVIYLAVLCDDPDNADKDVINDLAPIALDQITLMKILPRIEGDYDMFNTSEDKNKLEQLQDLFAEDSSSWKKLDEMNKRLVTTEFTRFWP